MATTAHLSHFSAVIVASFFIAIVFGISMKNTQREMMLESVRYFLYFVVGTFLAGWAMALLRYLAVRQ